MLKRRQCTMVTSVCPVPKAQVSVPPPPPLARPPLRIPPGRMDRGTTGTDATPANPERHKRSWHLARPPRSGCPGCNSQMSMISW